MAENEEEREVREKFEGGCRARSAGDLRGVRGALRNRGGGGRGTFVYNDDKGRAT